MTAPHFSSRVAVQVVSEERYGVDPGGGVLVPVYGEVMPALDSTVNMMARSQRGMGSAGVKQAFGAWRVPAIKTYVCGSGTAGTPPPWMYLLDGAGMQRAGDPVDLDRTVWRPSPSPAKSVTIRQFLGGRKYLACGSRGSWELQADAGQAVPITFDFQSPYRASEVEGFPEEEIGVPHAPPVLCNAGFVISPQGEADITPVLLAVRISHKLDLLPMEVSRRKGGVKEFRPSGTSTIFSAMIEYDTSIDWFEWFSQENPKRFNLTITVGQNVGERVRFRTFRPYRAALVQEPQFQSGSNGILLVNLVFGIRGRMDDSLEVVHE